MAALLLLHLVFHYFTTETETLALGPQVQKYGGALDPCPPLCHAVVPGPVTVRRPGVPWYRIVAVGEGALPRKRTKEVSLSPIHDKMPCMLTKETKNILGEQVTLGK